MSSFGTRPPSSECHSINSKPFNRFHSIGELSPALSPMLPSEPETSYPLSTPTSRTNPSTPTTGMFSASGSQACSSRPPITKAIDIWALGVTLYCFIYGRCPFHAETEFELFNIIPRMQPSYDPVPGREEVCPKLQDLLSRLLEKDVSKRITLKQVKVRISDKGRHVFVLQISMFPTLIVPSTHRFLYPNIGTPLGD